MQMMGAESFKRQFHEWIIFIVNFSIFKTSMLNNSGEKLEMAIWQKGAITTINLKRKGSAKPNHWNFVYSSLSWNSKYSKICSTKKVIKKESDLFVFIKKLDYWAKFAQSLTSGIFVYSSLSRNSNYYSLPN